MLFTINRKIFVVHKFPDGFLKLFEKILVQVVIFIAVNGTRARGA